MYVNRIGRFTAAEVQHSRPKQCVEVRDVFANEVVLLHNRVVDVGVVVHADLA